MLVLNNMYFFGINLCDYSHIFGNPYEGPHSFRLPFINLAAVDVILTILGALIFARFTDYSFLKSCVIFFAVAFLLHWLFCVPTALNLMILGPFFDGSRNMSIP
uniref:Uncharacterized protein n=1 Tax=viral metagenome TaxID=1070528 RepID=A0A6C0EAG1_9ZZZZ